MNPTQAIAIALFTALPRVASSADLFLRPDEICTALASNGLPTQGWKPSQAVAGEFSCFSDLVQFGAGSSSGMRSNIAFYVDGTTRDRVNHIILKINVNNPATRSQAFERLGAATATLLASRGESMPPELTVALRDHVAVSIDSSLGRIEAVHEPGRIDSYKVLLTDPAFLAREEKEKDDAKGDFLRCLRVVADAAGYEQTSLSGDGEPVQESGYHSFFVKGREKDLFFCEVHSGGRYRVRGAVGGRFPFKLLREGTF